MWQKNSKTRFFYVLYSDKTWVFDHSQRAQSPIYIMMKGVSAVAVTLTSLRVTPKDGKKVSFSYVYYKLFPYKLIFFNLQKQLLNKYLWSTGEALKERSNMLTKTKR